MLCRARTLISNQLTQLAPASNSEVTNALREDLNQLLTSYGNPSMYPSSRNQALSMAHGHSSQRASGYSSRRYTSGGAGLHSSAYGPYSTTSQSALASRSESAAQPLGGQTITDPWEDRLLRPQTLTSHMGLMTVPSTAALQSQTAAPARPPGFGGPPSYLPLGMPDSLQRQTQRQGSTEAGATQLQGAGLSRATSDASAAGMSFVNYRIPQQMGQLLSATYCLQPAF